MASSVSLLASVPDSHGILFNRLILLALSVAALAVYAATYTIYNTRIASTGAFTPSPDSLLIVNGIALIPSTISIIWSVIHLSLLARRLLHAHRRNSRPITAEQSSKESGFRKAVVHPAWLLVADSHCFAFFVVAAVLTGVKVTKWRNTGPRASGRLIWEPVRPSLRQPESSITGASMPGIEWLI